MARTNPLLRAILSASHGAGIRPAAAADHPVGDVAGDRHRRDPQPTSQRYDLPLEPKQLDVGIEMVVRLVLSHVMQPSQAPARTADDIAWLAGRVLQVRD